MTNGTELKKTGRHCWTLEGPEYLIHFQGGKFQLHFGINEMGELASAIGVEELEHDPRWPQEPLTQEEVDAEIATGLPPDCAGTFGKFGLECDKCSRYRIDCNGAGEFA